MNPTNRIKRLPLSSLRAGFLALLLCGFSVDVLAQKTVDALVKEARESGVTEIAPADALKLVESDKDLFILDLREKDEYEKLRLPGSVLIPRGCLEFKILKNDMYPEINQGKVPRPDQPVLLVCKLGGRSVLAARVLKEMGYANVTVLKGGLQAWMSAKLPLQH